MQKPHWTNDLEMFAEHLRADARYHERRLTYTIASFVDEPWGIEQIEWDRRAIRNSEIRLRSFSGIFQDGTPVDYDVREVAGMSPRHIVRDLRTSIEVFLALPRWRPTSEDFNPEPAQSPPRFIRKTTNVPDFATGEPTTFDWLLPAPRILLQGEPDDDFLVIPAARIVRNTSNHFVFDEEYIPSILTLDGSPRLLAVIRELHDRLLSYQSILERKKARDAAEAVRQLRLDAVSEGLADLKIILDDPHAARPRQIHGSLSSLLGRLATFTRAGQAERVAYKYDDLGTVFSVLSEQVAFVLEQLGSSPYRRFAFEDVQRGMGRIEIRETSLFGDDFFLGVEGSDDLRELVPKAVRIVSMNDLRADRGAAVSGIRLTAELRPPANLPHGKIYFRLDKNDAHFAALFKTQEIGIHYQGPLPLANMAIYVTKAPVTSDDADT